MVMMIEQTLVTFLKMSPEVKKQETKKQWNDEQMERQNKMERRLTALLLFRGRWSYILRETF
jgi:hypothetical protein